MVNILNSRAIFLQIMKQQKAEAEGFEKRSLKLQSILGFSQSRKFEKFKRSNIVKCVQMKYFSSVIDKIISLTGSFSKALIILS